MPHKISCADDPNAEKQQRFRARQTVKKATKAAALKSAQAQVQELEVQIEQNRLREGAHVQFDADASACAPACCLRQRQLTLQERQ